MKDINIISFLLNKLFFLLLIKPLLKKCDYYTAKRLKSQLNKKSTNCAFYAPAPIIPKHAPTKIKASAMKVI